MKKYFLILYLFTMAGWLQAQSIKGKVVDLNGQALPGATIKVDNAAVTITDQDGIFTVECKPGKNVSVSSVGYESQSQTIQDCNSELTFTLAASTQMLDGVEITATSNQNKLMLNQPSSIAKLGELEIRRGTGLYLDDALNANVPGVFMQRRSVSGGQQINIRGYGAGGPGCVVPITISIARELRCI